MKFKQLEKYMLMLKKGKKNPSMDKPKFKTYHGNKNSRPCHNRRQ